MGPTKPRSRSFDDFRVGDRFESGPRAVSGEDIAAFAALSGDWTALHTDAAYAASTAFGGIVAHGALVLSIATGLTHATGLFEGTILAVRSMSVRYDRPVHPGDRLTLELVVSDLRPAPQEDRGTVLLGVAVRNQAGRRVLSGEWSMIVRRGRSDPAERRNT